MAKHERRIRRLMEVRDLPASLTDALQLPPEAKVQVTVEATSGQPDPELLAIMDRIGKQAQERGLTPELLDDILNDR